jgi:NAD(P)-dependent dehydrogenase (short-subunit alcohol dehydrogenase family)
VTDWTAADLPAFAGRTVIVTGANSGLGLVTARELARVGAHVVLAVRNAAKGDDAAAGMSGSVEVRKLDLEDLTSVREFADGVTAVDVLINNAGIMGVSYAQTVDGFESQIGTNHLGHFRADQSASAEGHRSGRHDFVAVPLDGQDRPR